VIGFDDDVLILLDAHDRCATAAQDAIDWDAARRRGVTADDPFRRAQSWLGSAVAAVRPYGVDVSSGVESAPGVKDALRLKRFFEAL
jgi:phosphoribosylanthranilate isomerase